MLKTSRAVIALAAAGVAVAVGIGVAATGTVDGPRETSPALRLSTTTAAEVTDGAAYVKEAIENLRVSETFRFTQVMTGAGSPADPGSGRVSGVVDLAKDTAEDPRYLARLALKRPDGEDVTMESIAIGEDVHVKGPKQDKFRKSEQKAKKSKGKKAGGGPATVDVIDPVLQLLEPVATLPAAAFSKPTEMRSDGTRAVSVTMPAATSLTVVVHDATRQIVRLEFVNGPRTATYTLSDVGATVEVPDPA